VSTAGSMRGQATELYSIRDHSFLDRTMDLLYCHIHERDYRRGFGFMIGFIGLSDTARDYALLFTITH
jgi:hypothetical protein